MRGLSATTARRLQDLEDEEDDEVDRSVPTTWGANNASQTFRSQNASQWGTSSASASVTNRGSARDNIFAPAFATSQRKEDPYQSANQYRKFSFATAAPSALEAAEWDVIDPDEQKKGRHAPQTQSKTDFADVFDPKSQPLEGTFGADKVIRIQEEKSLTPCGSVNSFAIDSTAGRPKNCLEVDSRLENPKLDVDPNIRANFLQVSRLHEAPRLQSEIARRNPSLVASNMGGKISAMIGGKLVTYTPVPVDERLKFLDRYGKYVDDKDRGQIKKRLKRQHKEDVLERDQQMLRATAEYRALASMTPSARTALLESLRKPLIFVGAFHEDQHEVAEIPMMYTSNPSVSRSRVMKWMGQSSLLSGSPSKFRNEQITEPSSISQANEDDGVFVYGALNNVDDDVGDQFAGNVSYIPLPRPLPRDNLYFADALYFGQNASRPGNLQSPRPPEAIRRTQIPTRSTSTHSQSQHATPKSLTASLGYRTDPGEIRSIYATYATSGDRDDPFTFDDTPEFKAPQEISVVLLDELTPDQKCLYDHATEITLKFGRVVLIRLHEPVIFSPSAIANRVSGAAIQEMQLFPTQRLAIVIFVHPTEARGFLRHVKNTYMYGRAEEIRALQIDAGWFGDAEKQAIVPAQPNIFCHLITEKASRTLRLHRIPLNKTVGELSYELGIRLGKGLLRVILCSPRQDYLKRRMGRQAVIEFMSVKEAIEAWTALTDGLIHEYTQSEPAFTKDASEDPYEEKKWCTCLGCRSQRESKESARGQSPRASTTSD